MNSFVKTVIASGLGFVLAFAVIFGIGMFFMAVLAGSGGEEKASVSKNTVLHLKFDQPIPEQTNNLEMDPFSLKNKDILGLNDIVETLEHAASDPKIKGIYLDLDGGLGTGIASASTLRKAIVKFKESGKFVVANSKYYTQGSYYLASTADQVYVNPLGTIDFHGFSALVPHFKDMLDKIGIKMEVFYAGDFKSATEPFRLNKMSENNRRQMREVLEPAFMSFLADIAETRKMDVAALRSIADGLKVRSAEDAVSLGLADKVGYLDEVIADMKDRVGIKPDDELQVVGLEDYATSFAKKKDYKAKDHIALVFAEGDLLMGEGTRGTITDNKYVKLIRELRTDEKVKAIVLRVNSGGGSAIASENIWRELSLAKEAGKKVVVSMGDYAASGGYYIACMADKIVAEPNTITGSIGVFSMMPNMSRLFDEKLGVHWDTVKTTAYSPGLNPFLNIAPLEQQYLQESTDKMYGIFLQRVAEGRGMPKDSVHKIAQGRIWLGSKAKEIGLVDEVGDLDQALAIAAELADLEKYRLDEYPKQPDPFQEFINELTGQGEDKGIRQNAVEKEFTELYPHYRQVKNWLTMDGAQARLPIIIDFK